MEMESGAGVTTVAYISRSMHISKCCVKTLLVCCCFLTEGLNIER